MFNSKISLDQFTHTLIEAINSANSRIQTGYIAQQQEDSFPAPPPLTVKNARISFNAHLSKQGGGHRGEALMLDFSKQGGNFHGELMLDIFEHTDEEYSQDEEYPQDDDTPSMPEMPSCASGREPDEIQNGGSAQGQDIPSCAKLFTQPPSAN